MKRKFGRVNLADSRDWKIKKPKSATYKTKKYKVDWIGDQKATPHCVAYAWLHWIHAEPVKPVSSKLPALQPGRLYSESKKLDEFKGEAYEGTSVRGGAKALQRRGFISEYRFAKTINDIRYAVSNIGPMVFGCYWPESWMNVESTQNAKGNVYIPRLNLVKGVFIGGHAVCLIGYQATLDNFLILNSWSDWGGNQMAWATAKDIEYLLKHEGEACVAYEKVPS